MIIVNGSVFPSFYCYLRNPLSFATFDFPLTENRVKHKLAFKMQKLAPQVVTFIL